jgi:two-component system chemotaxis response regulator CheB
MIRVLVAEDSLTVRELLVAILESDRGIRVVGQAKNGIEAVELAKQLRPDLITLDVHMPVMDGLQATKEIMVQAPAPIIIVSSSASGRDVELSLNALRAGALTVVSKPDDPRSPKFDGRQAQFLAMVKAMADVKVVRRWAEKPKRPERVQVARRRPGGRAVRAIAIAASTGGPAVLQEILRGLPRDFPVPILVVQHIAHGFVAGLADWLGASCDLRVKVAEHGEPLLARSVFLAPDDWHLGLGRESHVSLSDAPAVNGFRPSATFLFESAARTLGEAVVGVVLTGMGSDGVAGLASLKAAGGFVIAQDEPSSVVYGMPREAVEAGLADLVVPGEAISERLAELVGQPNRRGPDA